MRVMCNVWDYEQHANVICPVWNEVISALRVVKETSSRVCIREHESDDNDEANGEASD